jgi:mRNA interferase MazF
MGRLRTVTVASLTSGRHPTRFRVPVRFRRTDGLILPDQMRTLDRRRLNKRPGDLDQPALDAVLRVLREMVT